MRLAKQEIPPEQTIIIVGNIAEKYLLSPSTTAIQLKKINIIIDKKMKFNLRL